MMNGLRALRRDDLATAGLLAATGLVLAATAYLYVRGAIGYLDNGDGYYLYAARRVAQGAALYRTVMGTQPPAVYVLGAAIFNLGGGLPLVRLTSAAMRAVATALVFVVGRRAFADSRTAALSALVYALLPIGLQWDRVFDVNAPVTLAALVALVPLLRLTPRAALLGGLLAACAIFTKVTYLPALVATVAFLTLRRRRLVVPYIAGLILGLAVLCGMLVALCGSHAPLDAFLGQDASPLSATWLTASTAYVVQSEGFVILASLAGLVLALCYERRPAVSSLAWYAGGAAVVLLATIKEGTFGTVFELAEPGVALFAAYAAARWWSAAAGRVDRLIGVGALALVAIGLLIPLRGAVAGAAGGDTRPETRIASLIRAHAAPHSVIVAPPYYALLTDTRVPGDQADTYILAQRFRHGDRATTTLIRAVTRRLRAGTIPVVVTDERLDTIGPLSATIRATYYPVYSDTLPASVHSVVWLPRRRESPSR